MIRSPQQGRAGDFVHDIAGQFLLEADARHDGMAIEREFANGALSYRFAVGVPASSKERLLRAEFIPGIANPAVFVDGPCCLRHRWANDSLCMWDPNALASERWVCGDGLPALAAHVRLHLHCEAECRAGRPWPKVEMSGEHPRKPRCPSCRGRGR
ncbi:MAG: hypothetical protein WDZ46_03805 [Solirubrobacterales bacterium]